MQYIPHLPELRDQLPALSPRRNQPPPLPSKLSPYLPSCRAPLRTQLLWIACIAWHASESKHIDAAPPDWKCRPAGALSSKPWSPLVACNDRPHSTAITDLLAQLPTTINQQTTPLDRQARSST